MPLSRLDNFLKNVRGNIIYVNPNDLDATDSVTNQGNSMGRPFITIQRALIEASRFSYQSGLDNDRFGKTTILLSPGEHVVDNRPGWIPLSSSNYQLRDGTSSSDFTAFNANSNFDLTSSVNDLYKLNSVHGGVIVPRGVSIVGQDLRKTTIRPLYVPDPENDNIETSALFRITGGCYFFQFTIFDGNPNGNVYRNYGTGEIVPNFSHHKLTAFEYADGVNDVTIDDAFNSNLQTGRTDLDMYYEKVGLAYGTASGRQIQPDFPSSGLDIQPKIDEYRIVGPTGGSTEITSIISGDGTFLGRTNIITVTLAEPLFGLDVDTAFQVNGVTDNDYNGSFVVNEVVTGTDAGVTQFKYLNSVVPATASPTVSGSTVSLDTDTVTSSSPYIFNISVRSVYGMCGMHADGSKSTGFKSMVVAQFTGVSLQKDDNAFCKFDSSTGNFKFAATVPNIHSDPEAKYRPEYYNYHIKASNNAICQLVSIFAIGYSQHFVTESGGDFSVTNSNSNFGQLSLVSRGYRDISFRRDDVGYITNAIPPKILPTATVNLEYGSIDVTSTVGVGSTGRLYLHNESNISAPPENVIQGYRIGAKVDDELNLLITDEGVTDTYKSIIVMPDERDPKDPKVTSRKVSTVGRVGSANSISNNTITFTEDHRFLPGETIRVCSDNARIPDGLDHNRVYYAITNGSLNSDQIQIAVSPNDAATGTPISINNLGGTLIVESRVSDKAAGDVGHPIQYDETQSQWYINVSGITTQNAIYEKVVSLGTTSLGEATSRTFINRQPDNRSLDDRIYRYRYVIPSGVGIQSARPPRDGYVIQESNDVTGANDTEVALQFNPGSVTMSNLSQMRNFSFLRDASWSGGTATLTSELPHNLMIGGKVIVENVTSTNNLTGIANSAFNGEFTVTGITSATTFTVAGSTNDPGSFTNNTSVRTTALPTFKSVRANKTFYVYDVEQIKEYKVGEQDGIYYLTIIDSGNTPVVAPFNDSEKFAFSAPVVNLYPQLDRDNPVSDARSSQSYALPNILGDVAIDDPKNSITRQTLQKMNHAFHAGCGITDIQSNATGTAHTISLDRDHGYNAVAICTITPGDAGSGYGNGTGSIENLYNATLGIGASGTGATARITVNISGEMTNVKIMNGGCNYQVGDVLTVSGTATTTGFSAGSVTVQQIQNNIGDTISINGITSSTYSSYNQLYTITGVSTTREVEVSSRLPVSGVSTTGIGPIVTAGAYCRENGPKLDISALTYDHLSGVGTVTTLQNHGLVPDNTLIIGGATDNFYNRDFAVTQIKSLTEFNINIGVGTQSPTVSGTLSGYYPGQSSQAGTFTLYDENFGGRVSQSYAGISTVLSAAVTTTTTDEITVENLDTFNFNIGDYLRIDNEIMRIKSTVSGTNPLKVFRGLLGTRSATHINGSVVRRVSIFPVELRRTSIARASGHTFEYLGYGPGNYSTALPQRQAAQPGLKEQLLSQSFRSNGGVNVYTGMNDRGDFYIGNKRISSNTGKEEVFDTPVPTVTGEDVFIVGTETGVDVINPLDATISRSLKVEGGTQNNILSEFNGPVVFTEKITSTSEDGIEANNLFLQGDTIISRKYTVGLTQPTLAGNPGDVVYNANPTYGGTIGWTYATESGWYPFGSISIDQSSSQMVFDKVGIGTTTPGDNTFQVGSGTSIFSIDGEGGVGIGTTANGKTLRIEGDVVIGTGFTIFGDGSGISNQDSVWAKGGSNTFVYTKDDADNLKVGIGTSATVFATATIVGTAQTGLYVENESLFDGQSTFNDGVNVTGILTATGAFDLNNTSGSIIAGVVTSTNFSSGTGSTIFNATEGTPSSRYGVGIGTTVPRADLDVEGSLKLTNYYELPVSVTSSANQVELDLAKGQTFLLTTTENVTSFNLVNMTPDSAKTFTIKITQGSTPYTVDIDTFRLDGGSTFSAKWPGGSVPTVTAAPLTSDIYSYMTFDGGTTLYGVIGGQNFS